MIRKKLIDRGLGDTLAALGGARLGRLAGLTYMLCPVVLTVHGTLMGKRRRKPEERFSQSKEMLAESD